MNEWSQSLRSEFADKDYAHDYADELLYAYIATQIKVLRQQQNLRQEDLAKLAGMKQERISVMEDVNYSSWTVTTLLKLARAFDVRLRVSFENFSTVLDDMFRMSAESLRRTKREEDLGLVPPALGGAGASASGNQTINATYDFASNANSGSSQGMFIYVTRPTGRASVLEQEVEREPYEPFVGQFRQGNLAVSALRS